MKNKRVFRSLLSVLLALTMLVQLVPMSVFAQSSVLYGDVNSDGAIDNTDVDLLARYLSNDTSVEIDEDAADVDRNGVIDLNDLLYLVKLVKGADISLGQTATVTFDTNGGAAIAPISVVVGSTITAPEAKKDNAVFLGWYTDEEFTTPFYSSDPIISDVTVYAKYADVNGEPEYTPSAFALMDQSKGLIFTIERISGELAPVNAVTLVSADGSVAPKLVFTEVGEGKWNVSADGGYTEGASYILTLAEGYNFADKDASIREASFFIKKEEIANFTTNEDIIYIRDTASMTYTLADGTVCEVLDSAVLYNSEDVITGSFSYTGGADIDVGDTLCIYVTTSPTERDYINGNYDNDPTAYIVVETISGSTVTFRGMTMQGENSDVEKLISMPSTIPFSVLNLPEGNGTVDFADRDLAALITMYNTGAPESVKVGDFLVFYVGNFGSLRDGDTVYYKRVTAVNGTTITYVESSQEELLNAINLFLENDVDGDKMIENIDQGQLETQVMQQVEETGFAEDALKYLSSVVTSSDEFYDYVADNKIVVYDENGVKLTEEQIKAYGLGNSFELADDVELSFNITTCDGENSHFENGIKVTLTIGAEFEVDIGKDGKMGSLKIELGAAFTQEVCIDVNINATADITWIVCIPKINDIVFSSAVDVMSYTGVSIEAKFYTQEASEDFFDKLEENWGDKLGEDAMKKIKEFKKKYEDKFEEDSLGEDIEGFWESQTALIEDLIKNGEITEEQAESCLESHSENHIVQTFFSKAHL
ncbi:MAG: InlB B-repeat-containing protein, partial [Clostridia bacterium]|nr:InlB B-repeat-containing protein [Clostridia bacterium]